MELAWEGRKLALALRLKKVNVIFLIWTFPQVKPGMGKGEEFGYNSPEFFKYDKYSYFDIEKAVVDGGKRVEQPKSGLTEFWWTLSLATL